jgi:2-polyprenyl-3-methyl-5-hydroxy-6-metoxy-1,4-benzoquinol methylase
MPDYKSTTLAAYNIHPAYFADRFEQFKSYHLPALTRFLRQLQPNSYVLDLGAGGGTYASLIQEEGHEVLCLDNSEKMLDVCRSKGLDTIVMDMEEMDLGERYFDAIWAMASLIHVPKPHVSNILNRINSHMKDDGIFYVCVHEGNEEAFKKEKDMLQCIRYLTKFENEQIDHYLAPLFNVQHAWTSQGANGVTFLNRLCRKRIDNEKSN